MSDTKQLVFIRAKEDNGVYPLANYFEEIYANDVGLKKLGLRGDKNYLFYSIDGHGVGYYEQTEMELSAISAYDFFIDPSNKKRFFEGIDAILDKTQKWMNQIDDMDLASLENKDLARLFLKANQLHGDIFGYYVVSQPYRLQRLEDAARKELAKRVATSRIDHYLTLLATSEKPTRFTEEEVDWLQIVIDYRKNHDIHETTNLAERHPELWAAIERHFDKYKIITVGDGNWTFDINYFLNNLDQALHKDIAELEARRNQVLNKSRDVLSERARLIEELYLDPDTVTLLELLAELGHTRFMLRTDGWVPHVRTIIKLDIELSKRLNYEKFYLNFMSEEELSELAENWTIIPAEIIASRMGEDSKYLILNDRGVYRLYFGDEAMSVYLSLVPLVDHSTTKELAGTTAVLGKVSGRACVYRWGDNLAEKMEFIKQNPILVTGQTRPSMMPLIRLAKGIITDEGGVTSHAAIVSRELGIPSVIGTVHATTFFEDGDMVELDADTGTVRKIV